MCLIFLLSGLSSCGAPSLESINEKIQKEGYEATFTQKEYKQMAIYVNDNLDNIKNSYEFFFMDDKYPYMDKYLFILVEASKEGKLDSSTEKTMIEVERKLDYIQKEYGVSFEFEDID